MTIEILLFDFDDCIFHSQFNQRYWDDLPAHRKEYLQNLYEKYLIADRQFKSLKQRIETLKRPRPWTSRQEQAIREMPGELEQKEKKLVEKKTERWKLMRKIYPYLPKDPNHDLLQEEHRALLANIRDDIQVIKYTKVLVESNSLRQDDSQEMNNSVKKKTPSSFKTLEAFCQIIQEMSHHPDCSVEPFSQADIKENCTAGYSFYQQVHPELTLTDKKSYWDPTLLDEAKITTLFAKMHKAASENPNEEIILKFYDDRRDILECLKIFFKDHCPELIPPNVTLKLNHYRYDRLTRKPVLDQIDPIKDDQGNEIDPIKGHQNNKIDYNYRNNVKRMNNIQANHPIIMQNGGDIIINNDNIAAFKTAFMNEQYTTHLNHTVRDFEAASQKLQQHLYRAPSTPPGGETVETIKAREKAHKTLADIQFMHQKTLSDRDRLENIIEQLEHVTTEYMRHYPLQKINVRSLALADTNDPIPAGFSALKPDEKYHHIIFSSAASASVPTIKNLVATMVPPENCSSDTFLIDHFLSEDIYYEKANGYCFNHKHEPIPPNAIHARHFIYAEMHKIADEFRNAEEIMYDVCGASNEKIQEIFRYFRPNLHKIPKNVTLRLPIYGELKGTGEINFDYVKTVRAEIPQLQPAPVGEVREQINIEESLKKSLAKPKSFPEQEGIKKAWGIHDAVANKTIKNELNDIELNNTGLENIKTREPTSDIIFRKIKRCVDKPTNQQNIDNCIHLGIQLKERSAPKIVTTALLGLGGLLLIGFAVKFAIATFGFGTPLSLFLAVLGWSMIATASASGSVGLGYMMSWANKPKIPEVAEKFEPFCENIKQYRTPQMG